jgi:hypothetical protein
LTHMSISTYFRPNIHQNGPEILGVKVDKNPMWSRIIDHVSTIEKGLLTHLGRIIYRQRDLKQTK